MFRKEYKKAIDKIEIRKAEQIDAIFSKAEAQKPSKKKSMSFSFRTASAFAAVAVVALSLYAFPELSTLLNPATQEIEPVDLTTYQYQTFGGTALTNGSVNNEITSSPETKSQKREKDAPDNGFKSEKSDADTNSTVTNESRPASMQAYIPSVASQMTEVKEDSIISESDTVADEKTPILVKGAAGGSFRQVPDSFDTFDLPGGGVVYVTVYSDVSPALSTHISALPVEQLAGYEFHVETITDGKLFYADRNGKLFKIEAYRFTDVEIADFMYKIF